MAFPSGVSLATITVGSVIDFFGESTDISVTVTPVLGGDGKAKHIVHAETGHVLLIRSRLVQGSPGGPVSFDVPHVDQPGFVDSAGNAISNWAYSATVVYGKAKDDKWTKVFQPMLGQTLLDLDLIPDGNITAPVSAPLADVTSVNGQTGAVTLLEASPENVEAALPNRLTETELSATYAPGAGAAFHHPAYSFMRALHAGSRDLTWLHIGDSTSRSTKPWPRTLLDLLGQDYPAVTTKYVAPADADPLAYQPAETRQTGTGSRTLTLYNASRSGKSSLYAQGANWDILIAPVTPDLITVSHGHNDPATREFFRSNYTALVESLKAQYPYAEVVLIGQNPETNNSNMEVRGQEVVRLARQRGYGFVNIHDLFALRPGGYADLMLPGDAVHPNEAGHDLTAAEVKRTLTYSPLAVPLPSSPSSLIQSTENLSPEGAFIGWDGTSVPVGFTIMGPVTFEKDTTNFETKGYGVKVKASGPSGILQYDLPASRVPLVKGQEITLAVRMFVPSGQPAGAGRIGFRGDVQLVGNASTEGQGRFRWAVFTGRVTANPVVVRLMIYAADSGGTNGGEITIDRIITCRGTLPRDYFTAG